MRNPRIITDQRKIVTPNYGQFRNGMTSGKHVLQDAVRNQRSMNEVIRGFRGLDAVGGAFFFRELEYIKKKIFEVQYIPLSFRKMFSVTNEAGMGKKYITFRTYDGIATAQLITDQSDDLVAVDVSAREESIQVRWVGNSFRYTLGEIQASRTAGGEPLDARKMKKAVLGMETKLNAYAFYGTDLSTSAATMPSLFNNAYIPKSTAAEGASTSTGWGDKTPDEILADLHNGSNTVNSNSKGVFTVDALALPIDKYNYIASTYRSTLSETTILGAFVEKNPFITSIDSVFGVPELTGAATFIGGFSGNDTNDVMYFYNKNSDNVELEIPVEFQSMSPQERNLSYVINNWANYAGLNVYQPLSMSFVAGI